MIRVVYTCIVDQHDARLLAVAAVICLWACFTAFGLFGHAREMSGFRRAKWLTAAGGVFGAGVWATHFIAALAYRPAMPLDYAIGPTAASLVIAIVLALAGMFVALQPGAAFIGGGIIGLAVGAMHYVGMAALRAPAHLVWNGSYVLASIAVSVVLSALALEVANRRALPAAQVLATLLLAGAILGLHFTGMAAVWLEPDASLTIPASVFDRQIMAVAVAVVSGIILSFGLSCSLAEDRFARHASIEAARLRASEDHLARAQRIARVGSIRIDLVTGHPEWSEETYRIFGLSPDAPRSIDTFLKLVHPDDLPIVTSLLRTVKMGAARAAAEFRLIRNDGSERVVHDETEVVSDATGRPVVQITTIRDVTEERTAAARQRELERQLHHSQRLEALGTLAGGVAHDLNNTLVPVVAISKMLIDEFAPDSEQHTDLELIHRAGEHARALVQKIVAFSRQQEVVEQVVDLASVIRDTASLMRRSLPATIQIVEKIEDVPPMLGDRALLQQVAVNLMTNAAQAIGPQNGTITIGLTDEGASELCLSVADTGCGMDALTIDRAFEPFFTTKAVGSGSGLGLSVAHGIVTRHGGRIEVRSKPDAGTEFTVHLPVRARPAAPPPAAELVA